MQSPLPLKGWLVGKRQKRAACSVGKIQQSPRQKPGQEVFLLAGSCFYSPLAPGISTRKQGLFLQKHIQSAG